MKSTMMRTLVPATLAAAAIVIPVPAATADVPPDVILDPGLGCPGFALGLSRSDGNLVVKKFFDKNGNQVRLLEAGKGTLNTYTNYGPDPVNPVAGKSISVRTDGSVTSTEFNPDGTITVTATGHNGLIMFPTDVPAGPTTTQYTGKIVYTIDTMGTFKLVSTTGRALDVCDALK
ncbi:hypothetical protein [Pseudarthrobacter sp. NIBRBAC000502770]|uniref:hypothetical protein n=1 Tax=Pseudarthrobacter sp. NIBRBAC000502770 TaxID=2590785 RepID=UPI0011403E92|nr:hypothetical protein [Pseudarthrobacter sp. NIBRBAC000502770]QDG87566.1 hypothetical protein NIBR502770_02975 [Pseudarthrobacter sp. NIBRBAC000502770]